MPRILITGAGGQLGQELYAQHGQYPHWECFAPTREELDICNYKQVQKVFAEFRPMYCLNTAAYTAVDRAEEEADLAWQINAEAAKRLAELCRDTGTHLIHYSTDYVYAGGVGRPLREGDATGPAGVYAATKLEGDELIQAALASATIIRTSWVYSSFGHNFVKTMLRLGQERDHLRVVFDQIGTPTYARDLARATLTIIEQIAQGRMAIEKVAGVFHYSNEGVCSWYDFALAIFELANLHCEVSPIESHEYPTPAKRPPFSVLNKSKIKAVSGIEIPHWRAALSECLEVLGHKV